MPVRETLNASPARLADVLSNGKRYLVPPFQRDYAWDETEWSDLWADILALGRSSDDLGDHFLGALVFQPTGHRDEKNIIDGQQRLVTLSLLALAVIVRIEHLAAAGHEADDNRERARLLRERFVSTRDLASLEHRSRLRLNATDNAFYQTYLVQGIPPPHPHALKGSEARLLRAYTFFDQAVERHLGSGATGADLAGFLEGVIANRLRFIEIVVEDDEAAFLVFETLNARGLALSTVDLLKNYLFSVASRGGSSDLEQARLLWDQVLRWVPLPEIEALLFHKLAVTEPLVRERGVFSAVKRIVPQARSVFDFLRDLQGAAQVCAALDDPNDDFWVDFPDARKSVRVLSLLGATDVRPVILAAIERFRGRPDKVSRLLKNLVTISVRCAICPVSTGDLQRAHQSTAVRIERGDLKSPLAIARSLAGVTPSDDELRSAFAVLAVDPRGPQKKWVRYLLAELEGASGGHPIDFEVADVTIEHILPENAGAGWDAFSLADRARDVSRLGNLTPLEHGLNKGLGASDFGRKRVVYEQSRYELTRGITAAEWTPGAIRSRQEGLADLAVRVWALAEDSLAGAGGDSSGE